MRVLQSYSLCSSPYRGVRDVQQLELPQFRISVEVEHLVVVHLVHH